MSPEQIIRRLFIRFTQSKVTDVYFIPEKCRYRLLTKIDQKTHFVKNFSLEDGQRLIAYLKYSANMSLTEHRRPQGGAIEWKGLDQEIIDVRLSTVGDFQGLESLVIRFIYPLKKTEYNLFATQQWQVLKNMTAKQGLVLFAGPTGSGKTTTMYRLARQQKEDRVILTIEDPVEIKESKFLQLQVNAVAGLTYESLLRVALRHRPDVMIIGEIRDPCTAKVAIEAALSGHLVLATVHAKSARGVLTRLYQLGIAEYYVRQALIGTCYQRLIPKNNGQYAVLFDIFTQIEKENVYLDSKIGPEWQQLLTQGQNTGEISNETKNKYWEG